MFFFFENVQVSEAKESFRRQQKDSADEHHIDRCAHCPSRGFLIDAYGILHR